MGKIVATHQEKRARRLTEKMKNGLELEQTKFDGQLALQMAEQKMGKPYDPQLKNRLTDVFQSAINGHDRDEETKYGRKPRRRINKPAHEQGSGLLASASSEEQAKEVLQAVLDEVPSVDLGPQEASPPPSPLELGPAQPDADRNDEYQAASEERRKLWVEFDKQVTPEGMQEVLARIGQVNERIYAMLAYVDFTKLVAPL